jgi:prepilin-type N-terminal cleavage/methylation domain-containing protein/prepilin-type processing-associated H-X9-DG protein
MKSKLTKQSCKALTLVEVLVVIAVLVIVAAMLFWPRPRATARAPRISCMNNLKQIGTAFRIWAGDHNERYSILVPAREGGTLEFATGSEVFRHFQILSNELGQAPKVVICPADAKRESAQSFSNNFNNSTLSYFIGIDANDNFPQRLQSGDRNLSDSDQMQHGLFARSTNHSVRWTKDMHSNGGSSAGNVLMGDGSVQQASTKGLQFYWENTGIPTNRLTLP